MEPAANNNVNMYSMNQPPQKSYRRLIVGIIIVVLLIIGGTVVYSLLGSDTYTTPMTETTDETTPSASDLEASVRASIANDEASLDQEISSIDPQSLDQE